jgi:acyl-CoA synthetase (AMP-forming)/AMP-acid ligase II
VTYGQLWKAARCAHAHFVAEGVQRGDRVAVALENSLDYVAACYGAWLAGAVIVPMNPKARLRELQCWLQHCDAKLLLVHASHPDARELGASSGGRLRPVPATPAGDIPQWCANCQDELVPVFPDATAAAAIVYTSGTTGRPKGVTLSHGNLASNTDAIIRYLELMEADSALAALPFFYAYGSSVLHSHLAVGGTLVLERQTAFPAAMLARVAAERVTGLPGVPSTFAMLLQSGDLNRFDLSHLRYITQAGGAMPLHHARLLSELLPHTRLFVMYGQTEATARVTYLPPERLAGKIGSVGVPIDGVALQIIDDSGRPLAPLSAGEVCVRGPNVMQGYFNDPVATAVVLRDGWLRTGDIGYLDGDGFLYLKGRRSDIIKSGAHRISPLDIEDVIAELPEVAEVAVVGVADALLGEVIKATIALKPGATLTGLVVQRYCLKHLPHYKVPRLVEFVSTLPKTPNGKVIRRLLTHSGDSRNDNTFKAPDGARL